MSNLDCKGLLSQFNYEIDARNPPDNYRKGQFRAGWRLKNIDTKRLEARLTWRNLGFRLGKLMGPKTNDEVDKIYEQFARNYIDNPPSRVNRDPLINEVLNAITIEYIQRALVDFDSGVEHRFHHSIDYDLLHEGRRYPPKAVIGLAARYVVGSPLNPSDFTGGEGSTCFRVLRAHGFNIVPKAELTIFPDEVDSRHAYAEGASQQILVNKYERSDEARNECIRHYGAKCQVCDFRFSETYGEIGSGFIHVHHLRQLSEIRSEYVVDPINDLRPVCPNCHAMLHRRNPPYTLDELRSIIEQQTGS